MSIACSELLAVLRPVYLDITVMVNRAQNRLHRSDDSVRVAIHKRPASTHSVTPINMYIHLFIRFCNYVLILRSALYSNC